MRKHHTTRGPGRATVRSPRRSGAGLLAGAAAAGALLFTHPAATGAATLHTTRAGTPGPVGAQRIVLAAATTTAGPLWVVQASGSVSSPAGSAVLGSAAGLNAPIVAAAPTPTGRGYWLVGSDGGVFSFGDAAFYGSTGGLRLNRPIVGVAATPTGRGYWLVASDGGVFSFGDAAFHGSTGSLRLNQPIVGMAATPSGNGYWLVASDGGIFTFGDAGFHGSLGSVRLNQPIVAMAATPTGGGYWALASDGGVFSFGDAAFRGSTGANPPASPVRAMVADPAGGYWLASANGALYPFGPVGARPAMTVVAPLQVQTAAAPEGSAPGVLAVNFARSQEGVPYAWGGTGAGGYDCSGLTEASWRAAGVSLPRLAAAQYDAGAHVPVGAAQPGDLVFWSSSASPAGIYHVGVAVGGGMMIDAAHPGTVVREEAIWPGVFPLATRP